MTDDGRVEKSAMLADVRFALPTTISRFGRETRREYAVRLYRSWRDQGVPRRLTVEEATDLAVVQGVSAPFARQYTHDDVPLAAVAVLASKVRE